jgi:hypothetical protein
MVRDEADLMDLLGVRWPATTPPSAAARRGLSIETAGGDVAPDQPAAPWSRP